MVLALALSKVPVHLDYPLQTNLTFLTPHPDLAKPSRAGSWHKVVFFPGPIPWFLTPSPTHLSPRPVVLKLQGHQNLQDSSLNPGEQRSLSRVGDSEELGWALENSHLQQVPR